MSRTGEHRGITYVIPNSDDGTWRWVVYPREIKGFGAINVFPRPVYATSDEAVEAAKRAIDAILDGKSN